MKVKELMSAKVISLSPDDSIMEAAKLMTDKDIGFIVLINQERAPLGVVTDRDIVTRVLAKGKGLEATIDDAATHSILSVNKETEIEVAVEMMKDHQVRRLVVVNDDEKLVGVISIREIATCPYTKELMNELMLGIHLYNKKTYEPLKYLEVDSYPL